MTFLARFFGGMTITGYVMTGLVTLLLTAAILLAFLNHANGELRQELGELESSLMVVIDANHQNRVSIDELEGLLNRCVKARKDAETAVEAARLDLAKNSLNAKHATDGRTKSISEAVNTPPVCECVVPPRATELLIQAACSANRDTDCP